MKVLPAPGRDETVIAEAHDTPVIGWQGKWANTLRLWAAKPTTLFDLDRFNRGDYAAAGAGLQEVNGLLDELE